MKTCAVPRRHRPSAYTDDVTTIGRLTTALTCESLAVTRVIGRRLAQLQYQKHHHHYHHTLVISTAVVTERNVQVHNNCGSLPTVFLFIFIFTARAYARAVLGVIILSVRPSVRPSVRLSVCHTRGL